MGKPARAKLTEADLEVRVSKLLATLFPGIKTNHQKTFSIRIGRNSHEIGRKGDWAKGRADILVMSGGRALAVIELKAPGEPLGNAVDPQAISYARLMHPMAPLVVVTNGDDTRILTSYDGTPLQTNTIEAAAVAELFARAAQLAAADHDAAVRAILDRDDGVFASVLSSETHRTLEELTGPASDLGFPLASDFRLPRDIVADIAELVGDGSELVVVVGAGLSGRTNVLAQLCQRKDFPAIYVDAGDVAYGPLRYMSNLLGQVLFRALDTEDVRRWLFGRLKNKGGDQISIVLDGFGGSSVGKVREDVDELLQLLKGTGVSLIMAMDEVWFELLSRTASGGTTAFGRQATRLDLLPLSDPEFRKAAATFADDWNMVMGRGSRLSPDYREPRNLRLIAATAPGGKPKLDEKRERITAFRAPATTGPYLPDMAWRHRATPQLRDDLLQLAEAAMSDPATARRDLVTMLRIHELGAVSLAHAEQSLGSTRVDRLLASGLASYVSSPIGERYLVARVPEMLAVAAAFKIADRTLRAVADGGDVPTVYGNFVADCQAAPLPDVVGAWALWRICEAKASVGARLLELLLRDEPDVEITRGGSRLLLQIPDEDPVEIDLPPDFDCPSLGNTLPYLILSYFMARPMAGGRQGATDGDINLEIAVTVGSVPHVLMRVDPRRSELLRVMTHGLPQGGSAICPEEGAVEPLVESMIQFLQWPAFGARRTEMIDRLATEAAGPNREALALRLGTVFGILSSSTDTVIAVAARATLDGKLGAVYETLMTAIHAADGHTGADEVEPDMAFEPQDLRDQLVSSTAIALFLPAPASEPLRTRRPESPRTLVTHHGL